MQSREMYSVLAVYSVFTCSWYQAPCVIHMFSVSHGFALVNHCRVKCLELPIVASCFYKIDARMRTLQFAADIWDLQACHSRRALLFSLSLKLNSYRHWCYAHNADESFVCCRIIIIKKWRKLRWFKSCQLEVFCSLSGSHCKVQIGCNSRITNYLLIAYIHKSGWIIDLLSNMSK
jgi:hypothetical protein